MICNGYMILFYFYTGNIYTYWFKYAVLLYFSFAEQEFCTKDIKGSSFICPKEACTIQLFKKIKSQAVI